MDAKLIQSLMQTMTEMIEGLPAGNPSINLVILFLLPLQSLRLLEALSNQYSIQYL